jgi:hypothetical protein
MGARITGAGTPEIRIQGVDKLTGVEHRIIPDRIEAGTFIIAAAITNGELLLRNCNLGHLVSLVDRLEEVGVRLESSVEGVRVTSSRRLSAVEMTTQPYPGFPTDIQAPLPSSKACMSFTARRSCAATSAHPQPSCWPVSPLAGQRGSTACITSTAATRRSSRSSSRLVPTSSA